MAQRVKYMPWMQETWVWSLGWEDPLEKEMANHSFILAWRIPWTEEPGRLQFMGSQRVRHDWVKFTHIRSTGQSCGTEPLTCGIWCYLHVHGVRIELNGRTSIWYQSIVWWCRKTLSKWNWVDQNFYHGYVSFYLSINWLTGILVISIWGFTKYSH